MFPSRHCLFLLRADSGKYRQRTRRLGQRKAPPEGRLEQASQLRLLYGTCTTRPSAAVSNLKVAPPRVFLDVAAHAVALAVVFV